MRLTQVTIKNFRCFEHLEMDLDPHLNVIVGNNGSGKTSVTDAIAIGFRMMFTKNSEIDFVDISDLRSVEATTGRLSARISLVDQKDSCGYDIDLKPIKRGKVWSIRAEGRGLGSLVMNVPLCVYYRADRRGSRIGAIETIEIGDSGFDASTGYSDSEAWFEEKEIEELRRQKERSDHSFALRELESVRQAVMRHMVPEAEFLGFSATTPARLQVKWKENGGTVTRYVSQLSDGYKNMLALVMDFARRLAEANPGSDNPLDAEAILLIDEIELHLHPKWQQTVLADLRKTFPNTQIIVTTHSPQVLTTVESKHIRILKDGKVFAAPAATYGAEASRLLESVLGVPVRPPNNVNAENIAKVHNLIIEGKIEAAERLLEELREWSQGQEPAVAEAEMAIENKKWEAELDG